MNIEILRHLQIDDYIYTYKDELINSNYNYRCKFHQACKFIIIVNIEEIKKYIKDNKYKIKYEISGNKKINM